MREKPVLLMLVRQTGRRERQVQHVPGARPDPVSDPGDRGEDDPMHPIESQADIAAALPPSLVQFERFADCGHGVVPDAPERAMDLLQEFILRR